MSFGEETSGSVAKCRLFSQATWKQNHLIGSWQKKQNNPWYCWCHLRTTIDTIIENTGHFWLVKYLLQLIRSTSDLSSDVSWAWNFDPHFSDVGGKLVVTSPNVCPTSSGPSFSARTVLCKRNATEIRCFSFFVLAKIRRNFGTKFRQSAEMSAKRKWHARLMKKRDHGKEKNERRSANRLARFPLPAFLCV